MSDFLKIENHPDLIKDKVSGAIVSNDTAAYAAYINRQEKLKRDATRLDNIENELSEVKELLQALLKRLN